MGKIEYKSISEQQYREYYQYGLIRTELRENFADLQVLDPFDPYAVYEDGELQMVIGDTVRDGAIRGGETKILLAGQAMVLPEYRRRGVMGVAVSKILESCIDRDVPFVIARQNVSGLYERYGAPYVSNRAIWKCEPECLLSAVDTPKGTFRPLTPDDWEELNAVQQACTSSYSISINRTREYWDWVVTNAYGTPNRISGWERDGELRGYVVYKSSDGNKITEVDMGYTDVEAYRHLLYYLGNHDSHSNLVVFQGPESGPVFDLVDSGGVECTIQPETILRITDVQAALKDIRYPTDHAVSMVIDVRDDVLPINHDTFNLTVKDGTAECTVTESDPDVTTDIATLAQLAVGYRSVSTLEKIGNLTIHTESGRTSLPNLFPPAVPFLRDDF